MRCSSCQKVISSSKAVGDPVKGWTCQECGAVRRGDFSEPLGGEAYCDGHPLICGDCSPDPLDYGTAVRFRVRQVGLNMQCQGYQKGVDVLECPRCGRQIIR